ncbi:MAG TPA: sulfurtransferase TusA family protein [Alphaproteobacteria bacterium]
MAAPGAGGGQQVTILDVRGLACPLPVLKARRAIRDVAAGGLLKVLATDPASVADFKSFCAVTGHRLEDSAEAGGVYSFVIRAKE